MLTYGPAGPGGYSPKEQPL